MFDKQIRSASSAAHVANVRFILGLIFLSMTKQFLMHILFVLLFGLQPVLAVTYSVIGSRKACAFLMQHPASGTTP